MHKKSSVQNSNQNSKDFEKLYGLSLHSTEKEMQRMDSSYHFYRIEGKNFEYGKFFQTTQMKLWLNHKQLSKDYTIHEVIGFPRRVVFDVDCKLDKNGCLEDCNELNGIQLTYEILLNDYIDAIKLTFEELFGIDIIPEQNIIVCQSKPSDKNNKINKISYHIGVIPFLITKKKHAVKIYETMKKYLRFPMNLDSNITHEKYNLRVTGFCKYDSESNKFKDNRKILLTKYLYNGHIIISNPNPKDNNIFGDDDNKERDLFLLTLNDTPTQNTKFHLELLNTFESDDSEKKYVSVNYDIFKVEELLNNTYSIFKIDTKNIRGNVIHLLKKNKRKKYYCDICSRYHESKEPFLIINKNHDVFFYCRGEVKSKKLLGKITYEKIEINEEPYETKEIKSINDNLSKIIRDEIIDDDSDIEIKSNELDFDKIIEECNKIVKINTNQNIKEEEKNITEDEPKSEKKTIKEAKIDEIIQKVIKHGKLNFYERCLYKFYKGKFISHETYEEPQLKHHLDSFVRERLIVIKANCGLGKSTRLKEILENEEFIAKLRIRKIDKICGEGASYSKIDSIYNTIKYRSKNLRINKTLGIFERIDKLIQSSGSVRELYKDYNFINQVFSNISLRVACIVPRIALGEKASKDHNFHYYKNIDSSISNFDKITIQIECMNKLVYDISNDDKSMYDYDIVILDEFCQSVIHFMNSPLFESRKKYFSPILKKAGLVIAMDAFIENIHVECLEEMSDKIAYCIHNKYKNQTDKKVNIFFDTGDVIEDIIQQLLKGKNIIVAYNSKNKGESLKNLVEKKVQGCKILLINSEERRQNQEICNVENWDKYQLIIHTSCISSGSSFTKDHFYRQYTFIDCRCVANSTDIVQSIFRSRRLQDKENSINIVLESWFNKGYIDGKYQENVVEFLRKRNYYMKIMYGGIKKNKNVLSDIATENMSKNELTNHINGILEKVRVYESGNYDELNEKDPFFKLYCYQLHREHYSRINMLEEVLALLREKGIGFGEFKCDLLNTKDKVLIDSKDMVSTTKKELELKDSNSNKTEETKSENSKDSDSKSNIQKTIYEEFIDELSAINEKDIDDIINAEQIESLDELNKTNIIKVNAVIKNFKIRKIYGHTADEIKNLDRNVVKELIQNLYIAERHNFILENEEKIIAQSGKSYDKSMTDLKACIATCMVRWAGFDGLYDINRFIEPNLLKLKEWMKRHKSKFNDIRGFNQDPVQFFNSLCKGTLLVRMKRLNKDSNIYCLTLNTSLGSGIRKGRKETIEEYSKRFAEIVESQTKLKQIKCDKCVKNWIMNEDGNCSRIENKTYYKISGNDKFTKE
jgi:hypothetical protein